MNTLTTLMQLVTQLVSDGLSIDLTALRFARGDASRLSLVALACGGAALFAIRWALARRSPGRVGVPAFLQAFGASRWSWVRHTPLVVGAAGMPFLVLALGDPFLPLTQHQDSFPGRRICIVLDASSSMIRPFSAPLLRANAGADSQATFFATVAAADRFVQLRTRDSRRRDLLALVEFGDNAYVVTPFTTDYDNIRLSLALVSDATEFTRFPSQGTIMSFAVDQAVSLFRKFDYLDAAGNLMVLFSDGEDAEVLGGTRTLADVVRGAQEAKVPIYFVRTRMNSPFGLVVSDANWKRAVEQTGGRFYAAPDEATLLQAIRDIDRAAVGQIEVTRYAKQEPKYRPFALAAAGIWTIAIGLALVFPAFRSFP